MTPTAVAQAPKPVLSPDAQIKATEAEIKANMTDLLSAMSNIQDEADRWDLADRLLKVVPQGTFGFERIIDAATQANVVGQFSATTLRLYRDTARNFPSDMRVKGCSFSAHREAERMPTIPEAIKVLDDLVKTKGSPSQVTVQAVRQAVRVRTGKTPPVSQTVGKVTSAGTGASTTLNEVFMDLKAGGTKLINAVPNTTPLEELDKIHDGLSKVIAHIERLRAAANRKAKDAAAKKASPKVEADTVAKQAAKAAAKPAEAGDMRGLK